MKEEREITLSVELILEEAVDLSQDGDISYILQLEVLESASKITPPHKWTVATSANTGRGN